MTQVYWTSPLTVSSLPVYPLGTAICFEKNEYGITGDGACSERYKALKVGDKVKLFMSFGHVSDMVKL